MKTILPKKAFYDKIVPFLLFSTVILVAVGGFGLGRLSTLKAEDKRVVIHAPAMTEALAVPVEHSENNTPVVVPIVPPEHNFVASKNGTKYYPANCKSASRIKDENRVWFTAPQDAVAAGFAAATTCKSKVQ